MAKVDSIYDLEFTDNRGNVRSLSEFRGHPLLIVNTASKCGLTPQYEGLEKLHQQYGPNQLGEKGLVVIGFPCDQFAHQEPGNDQDIAAFCSLNYGVSFDLSTKVDVNGGNAHPVFAWLKRRSGGWLGSAIKWNFTKFLVAPDGKSVKRFAPNTQPSAIAPEIERLVA